jgi:hypothetical protein
MLYGSKTKTIEKLWKRKELFLALLSLRFCLFLHSRYLTGPRRVDPVKCMPRARDFLAFVGAEVAMNARSVYPQRGKVVTQVCLY